MGLSHSQTQAFSILFAFLLPILITALPPLSHWFPFSLLLIFLLLLLSFLLESTHKRKHPVLTFQDLVYFAYPNGLHFQVSTILFLNILLIFSEFYTMYSYHNIPNSSHWLLVGLTPHNFQLYVSFFFFNSPSIVIFCGCGVIHWSVFDPPGAMPLIRNLPVLIPETMNCS